MAVKNLSTRVAIIGRGAKCRGGSSAVDKSAYISRTTMYSEYDGTTYYPKYTEDLVHNEVMLPVNAPAEYSDPSVLWNSVEMRESKSAKAQLARSYKINLPNEWSYELAIEVMRDYVKRNFVDDGMCAQFAIHDRIRTSVIFTAILCLPCVLFWKMVHGEISRRRFMHWTQTETR